MHWERAKARPSSMRATESLITSYLGLIHLSLLWLNLGRNSNIIQILWIWLGAQWNECQRAICLHLFLSTSFHLHWGSFCSYWWHFQVLKGSRW
jgi:hypothetical protein